MRRKLPAAAGPPVVTTPSAQNAVGSAAQRPAPGGGVTSSAPSGDRGGRLLLISNAPPRRSDLVLAIAVVAALIAALLLTVPFADIVLPGTETLIPAYFVAVLINQLITAALLFGLYAVQRSRSVLLLGGAYLFAGSMIVPWALTFPGAFPAFVLDVRLHGTATIAAVTRLSFPACILVYALSRGRSRSGRRPWPASAIPITVAAVVAAVVAFGAVIMFTDVPLPPFMQDGRTPAPLWGIVPPVALALCVAGILALALRPRSILDMWLIVVLISLVIEIVLLAYISGGVRLTAGWWAGRVFGLIAASTVLIVLLSGTTALYAQLARSLLIERRARESRLTMMEAVSASIAHELRQPLTSMEIGAAAGLRWLRRDPPDLREVEAALTRIESVGERAGKVVESVRNTFRTGEAVRSAVDVNAVIREVMSRCREETAVDRVIVRTDLVDPLPPVVIERLQLELVLSNLINNALDAMAAAAPPRQLSITSRRSTGAVIVSVADTGVGLSPEDKAQLFGAFFTTKPDGMGVGLMFCRSILDANGGRIWATDNAPSGAVFHIALPADTPDAAPDRSSRASGPSG